jgi:hypothetical protein
MVLGRFENNHFLQICKMGQKHFFEEIGIIEISDTLKIRGGGPISILNLSDFLIFWRFYPQFSS